MVFSSSLFLLVFLPMVWLGFMILAWCGWRRGLAGWLTLASLVFYAAWEVSLLPLLLGSVAVNFLLARAITAGHATMWFTLGVVFNLGLLGWFKYAAFLSPSLGLDNVPAPLVLPLGISFFTFQQIAFLSDVRKRLTSPGHPGEYLLFVSFFPQLVAGPIVHHRELSPQLARLQRPHHGQLMGGLLLLGLGLAKKLLVADNLAPYVDQRFALDAASMVAGDTLLAGWSYGLQLYFDFSGYADMALGLGLLFGLHLPENFASPYRASSIQAFWRRWHMTLSRFLRDYLYIPLGGNRHGMSRQLAALLITMLLGGLWHGAGWQFLLWGAIHGLLLTTATVWRRTGCPRVPALLGWALTLVAVMLAWIAFRAEDVSHALLLYAALGQPGWGALAELAVLPASGVMALLSPLTLVVVATLVALLMPNSMQCLRWCQQRRAVFVAGGMSGAAWVMALKALADQPTQAFLYFNF